MAFSLRKSLNLWRRREKARKKLHTRAQADLTNAREADIHPRQHLVDRRDLRSSQLKEARAWVARRLAQLAVKRGPKIVDLNLRPLRPLSRQPYISYVTGHYTAGPVDQSDDHCESLFRSYDRAHKAKGWNMVGYGFGISRRGTIYLLRPAKYVGAHVLNHNTGNVGVVCNGGPGDKPTVAQRRAFRWLLKNAHTDAMPADFRVDLRKAKVRGHNDWMATSCPGRFKRMYTSRGTAR